MASSPTTRSPDLLYAGLVFIAALAVRLAFGWAVKDLEFIGAVGLDSRFYHEMATGLAAGGSTEGAFFMGPLYPYTLSVVYRLFGSDVSVALAFQILLGSGTTCLSYLMGRKLFGRGTGIIAGILLTFYGYLLFLEQHVLTAPVLLFLLSLLAWLIVQAGSESRRWWYLATGVTIGLLSLGRGSFLLAGGLVVLVWLVRSWRQERRRTVSLAALVALGTALVVLPVTLRNAVTGGEFVLISSNGGINYYIGNHPDADGTFVSVPGVEFFQPGMPADGGSIALAEQKVGHPLSSGAASRFWLSSGLSWNLENPGKTIGLWGRRLVMALGNFEIPQIENYEWARQSSGLLRFGGVRFGWLVALGIVGMVLAWRQVPSSRALVLLAGAILVSMLPFFITARHRIPLAPLLAIFAAHALVMIWKKMRAGDLRSWLVPVGTVAVILVLVNLYQPAGIQAESDRLHDYSLGVLAVRENRLDDALNHFERSLRTYPDHVPTLANLGTLYAHHGRFAQAVPLFERILAIEPGNFRIMETYATCLEQVGRGQDAARVRRQLRTILESQGN